MINAYFKAYIFFLEQCAENLQNMVLLCKSEIVEAEIEIVSYLAYI